MNVYPLILYNNPTCFISDFSMQSLEHINLKNCRQFDHLQEAVSEFGSNYINFVTEDEIIHIPGTLKMFSPLLTNIIGHQISHEETTIITPNISSTSILRLNELVSHGFIEDDCWTYDDDTHNIIVNDIVDVAKLFDIKVSRWSITSRKQELEKPGHGVLFKCSEIQSNSKLMVNSVIKEVEIVDHIKEEDFSIQSYYNVRTDFDIKEDLQNSELCGDGASTFCVPWGTEDKDSFGDVIDSKMPHLMTNHTGKNGTNFKSIEWVETNEGEKATASCRVNAESKFQPTIPNFSQNSGRAKNADKMSKVYYDKQTVSYNRFELEVKRLKSSQIECLLHTGSKKLPRSESCSYESYDKSVHKKSADDGVKLSCNSCRYQTEFKELLEHHVLAKHKYEGVRYSCHLCNYRSNSELRLKNHVQAKHECVRFSCENCNYQSTSKADLKRHVKSNHDGVSFSCESCNFQSQSLCHLMLHVETEHKWGHIV